MRVLITGAAGRVGVNLVRRLTTSGIDVKAMVMPRDPLAARLEPFGVEIVEADLRDQSGVTAACRDVTHVVHLAAQLVRGATPVDVFYDVNALGTLRLLEGAVHAARLERFVLVSTEGTYRPGAPPSVPVTEETPQLPGEYYGASKLLGEIILRNHAEQFDIPFSIARFPTVVSPEEAPRIFRLGFMKALLAYQREGRSNHLWPLFDGQPDVLALLESQVGDAPDHSAAGLVGPDGPWRMSMVDVRDAVDGVRLALLDAGAVGAAFNIAAAQATGFDEGADIVARAFDVPKVTVEMPMTWCLELSIERAQRVLGYEPRYAYEDMVASATADSLPTDAEFVPAGTASGVGALS